ncbi:MAG TPA: futalosine hydrolase [Jatrophihabitans sp.]|jgi:futalosine hydrolase|uniref:futalosine hydrolase n=1 Tax=Jatrophihabitans sp. TaxID=1932789 RepID=UPI002F1B97AE
MSASTRIASVRILVVTAVEAERDAVLAGLAGRPAVGAVQGVRVHRALTGAGLLDVACVGVGPVAAAVGSGCLLRQHYDLALSAGIGGGFAPVEVGAVVIADAVVHADLGAETGDGFVSMAELGWGAVRYPVDEALAAELSRRTGAVTGAVLSVSTVTGSQQRADQLLARHPDAVAEAMEGVGVCLAAGQAGVPFAELRAIANPVGPRDREAWRIPDALAALSAAFGQLLATPLGVRAADDEPAPGAGR